MRLQTLLPLLGVLYLTACGPAAVGESCGSNGDCEDGLQCILSGSIDIGADGLECSTDKLCSKPCSTDSDCESVGDGLICIADCHAGSCLKGSHN